MFTAQQITNYVIGGLSIQSLLTKTESAQIGLEIPLPAGQAGTLTAKTDADTGSATLDDTPSVAQNDIVDVFWPSGIRYGMTVGVVAGNVVPLDGGGGDDLPATTTALVVTERVPINVDVDGDDIAMIVAACDQRAHLDFEDAGSGSFFTHEIVNSGGSWIGWSWTADQGIANPLTGNPIDEIQASNGSTTPTTLLIGVLYDATP